MNPYTYRGASSSSNGTGSSLGTSTLSFLKEVVTAKINPVMAVAMVVFAATSVLAITLVAHSEVANSEGSIVGRLASSVHKSKVLGASYGYASPSVSNCNNYVCMTVTAGNYQDGAYSATVYYSLQKNSRVGAIKVNGSSLGTNLRGEGYLSTGYTLAPGAEAKVDFYNTARGTGRSRMTLRLTMPAAPIISSISITDPIEGDEWVKGQTETISWDAENVNSINIYAYRTDCAAYSCPNAIIATNVPASQETYSWNVNVPTGHYKIVVETAEGRYAVDSANISVVTQRSQKKLTLVSPTQNQQIAAGGTQSISWSSTGVKYVTITLSGTGNNGCYQYSCTANGSQMTLFGSIPASQGSVSWGVSVPAGTYTLGIISEDGSASDRAQINIFVPSPTIRTGSVVNDHGTIFYVGSNALYGFASIDAFNSWGFTLGSVVDANNSESALPRGAILTSKPANCGSVNDYIAGRCTTSVSGKLMVTKDNSSASFSVAPGSTHVALGKFLMQAGNDSSVVVKQLGFTVSGPVSNVQVYYNGVNVTYRDAVANNNTNKYLVDITSPVIPANMTMPVTIYGDIPSGASVGSTYVVYLTDVVGSPEQVNPAIISGLPVGGYTVTVQAVSNTPVCSTLSQSGQVVTDATGTKTFSVSGVQNVSAISFAVYRPVNGQNLDLQWYQGVQQSDGTTWNLPVDLSKITANGTVSVDVYMTGTNGSSVGCGSINFTRSVQVSTAPVCSSVASSASSVTDGSGTVDVLVKGTSNVASVAVAVYHDGQADLEWLQAAKQSDGTTWKATVDLSKHRGAGSLHADAYMTGTNGSFVGCGSAQTSITKAPVDPVVTTPMCSGVTASASTITSSTGFFDFLINGVKNVSVVSVAVYRPVNGQNADLQWYTAVKQSDGTTWKASADLSKITGNGTVSADAYMTGTNGSFVGCGSTTVTRSIQ